MSSTDDRHPLERISALLDAELPASERAEVEAHLAGCGACRALLDDLRRLASAAAREEVPPVPGGLEARIGWRLRAAGSAAAPARPRWRRLMPLTAAASIVAAALLVTLWVHDRELREGTRVPAVQPTPSAVSAIPAAPEKAEPEAAKPLSPPQSEVRRPALEEAARSRRRLEAPASKAPAARPGKERRAQEAPSFAPAPAPTAAPPEPAPRDEDAATGLAREAPLPETGPVEGAGDLAASPRGAATRPLSASSSAERIAATAACPSAWDLSAARPWVWRRADAGAAERDLRALAQRLGGTVGPLDRDGALWRFESARSRLPELIEGLRSFGVEGTESGGAPPPDAACVAVRIVLAPASPGNR